MIFPALAYNGGMILGGEKISALLREFRTDLGQIYGSRLRGIYLFGSYARGDMDEESDLDVLIVLDDFDSYAKEIDRVSEIGARLSLEFGVSLSKIFTRERDWMHGETPFLANVRGESVPA